MKRFPWTTWLLVLALGLQFSGVLRGLHEATAHGGDSCHPCALTGETAPGYGPDDTPDDKPGSPEREDDCALCFFLTHGVVYGGAAGEPAALATPTAGTVTLTDASLCERVGVFVLRSRGPPAVRC